ncbi:peptidoglycan-binding domain-containing protein [Streptomyces sp. NPDC050619]|uniref:peptidoglycan-binding domain-containing protein n=1 Tax=Streptomyces sp. NPDC050619 TaxID=3157214 RepID=UPI00342089D1
MSDSFPPDEPGGAVPGSRLARRRRWTVVAACSAALLSAGGVYAAQWVRSPAEAAARTRAPKASVITAPVVRQVMRNTMVFRGSFSDGRTVSAAPTDVAVTQPVTQPAAQPSALLVTGVFTRAGRRVGAAKPLVEYDARPVFALPGTFPMYRDLTMGEEGKDVAQLQRALRSLGRPTGSDPSGTFGPGTAAAVKHMYAAMGYAAPLTTSADTGSATEHDTGSAAEQSGSATRALGSAAPSTAGPKATVTLPASEVVFVPSLPARVVSVPVHVGDPVKGPVITLARGDMTLTGFLDPSERGLVSAGAKADILAEAIGTHAAGTVESVGALVTPGTGNDKPSPDNGPADPQTGGAYVPVRIEGRGTWDKRFADQDVRITITAAATSRAVTAVPEAAVTAGADARTTVTVVTASGAQHVVPVTTGVSADGLVQVTPTRGHTLRARDRVVVGT